MASKQTVLLLLSLLASSGCVADLDLGETEATSGASNSGGTDTPVTFGDTDGGDTTAASSSSGGSAGVDDGGSDSGAVPPPAWPAGYAQARCEALFGCGCPSNVNFGDLESCVAQFEGLLLDRQTEAMSFGADQFSPACHQSQLEQLTGDSCDLLAPPASFIEVTTAAFCPLFVGSAGEGEACMGPGSPFADDSSCAEGLRCRDNLCVALPGQGEPCLQGVFGAECDAPWACVDGVCATRRVADESCEPGQCDETFQCEDGACAPRLAAGEPCVQGLECSSSLCAEDVCQPPVAALCGPYLFEER